MPCCWNCARKTTSSSITNRRVWTRSESADRRNRRRQVHPYDALGPSFGRKSLRGNCSSRSGTGPVACVFEATPARLTSWSQWIRCSGRGNILRREVTAAGKARYSSTTSGNCQCAEGFSAGAGAGARAERFFGRVRSGATTLSAGSQCGHFRRAVHEAFTIVAAAQQSWRPCKPMSRIGCAWRICGVSRQKKSIRRNWRRAKKKRWWRRNAYWRMRKALYCGAGCA